MVINKKYRDSIFWLDYDGNVLPHNYLVKKRVGRMASMTWFLRIGATGFEPAT